MEGGAVDLLQGRERRATLVQVEYVEQEAGVAAAGRDGDVDAMRQRSEHGVRTPELEERLHAHLLAHVERLPVVPGSVVETDAGAAVARRRGDAAPADLRHLFHVDLQLLHPRTAS